MPDELKKELSDLMTYEHPDDRDMLMGVFEHWVAKNYILRSEHERIIKDYDEQLLMIKV